MSSPRISRARSSASSGLAASLTPPALPRPPVSTWAFTTTVPPPSFSAAVRASSGVWTTSPTVVPTPCLAKTVFAWYSIKSTTVVPLSPVRVGRAAGGQFPRRVRSPARSVGPRLATPVHKATAGVQAETTVTGSWSDRARLDLMTETDTRPADDWWRSAVVYQVYPRSFADADGDGTGDLNGIRARLPYLAELGVDAIWISPWYPSPLLDGGYDVSDYRDINPEFGTLADADALITEAHALGLRILIDLVPNHCSWEHPWFKAALDAGKGSPERDLFWFRDGKEGGLPPTNWPAAFGGGAWQQTSDDS